MSFNLETTIFKTDFVKRISYRKETLNLIEINNEFKEKKIKF